MFFVYAYLSMGLMAVLTVEYARWSGHVHGEIRYATTNEPGVWIEQSLPWTDKALNWIFLLLLWPMLPWMSWRDHKADVDWYV